MPLIPTNTGSELSMDSLENRKILKYGWLRDQWVEDDLWHPEEYGSTALKRLAAVFFQKQYETIIEMDVP
jgi:hypothetical protein